MSSTRLIRLLLFGSVAALCVPFRMTAAEESTLPDLLAQVTPEFRLVAPETTAWAETVEFTSVGRYRVQARWQFEGDTVGEFQSLQLRKPYELERWKLNGTELNLPLEGMRYLVLPGVPVRLVKPGRNTLEVEWPVEVRLRDGELRPNRIQPKVQLNGLKSEQLEFQTTPVIGAATTRSVSMSCRMNMPARVVLHIDNREFVSPGGLLHTFRVDGLKPNTTYSYRLEAKLDGTTRNCGPFQTRTLPTAEDFTFVAMGDSRGDPKDWAAVANAAMASSPALALFSGDMIHDGRLDGVWDRNFFTPARNYFATIPTYYVYGNHENQSPMLDQFFVPAGDARRWSIVVGSVRMIGLDGGLNWTDRSENYRWLEQELAGSREKFIFVATHYPPWTSGPHGKLNSEGRPGERPIYEGQRYLMPLFEKYQVTAVICGHDHVYERSEPGRVSVIVTGGAGAPLYEQAENAVGQNPHSKVFVKAFHYCHFTVEGKVCRLRVLTPDGKVLDEHSWPARSRAGS